MGHRGEQLVEVTPNGTIVSETEKTPATSGNTVYLTIDARLQKIALDALKETWRPPEGGKLRLPVYRLRGGAGCK